MNIDRNLSKRAARRIGNAALMAMIVSSIAYGADAAPTVSLNRAEFGGQSVDALAEGRHIMTDCSTTWTDKDGKVYCFKNEAAKATFVKSPQENLDRARSFIAASSVESTEKALQYFENTDAEFLVNAQIAETAAANGGFFPIEDALTGQKLRLKYDGIDFTRTIDGYGFFPDVKFHDEKDAQKNYLVDFWVVPDGGQLKIQETRIYQAPEKVDGKWQATVRQPIPWWWIPASEHPGHMAGKRSWEVMSAVEHEALLQSAKNNGVFKLTDDKTGKELDLTFVDTHQSIRQLDDNGHFFACTDFRVAGTKDQIYDIDFWITEKDGKMIVEQTKVHKVPEQKGGQWIQIPRYSWKDVGNSHVVP